MVSAGNWASLEGQGWLHSGLKGQSWVQSHARYPLQGQLKGLPASPCDLKV